MSAILHCEGVRELRWQGKLNTARWEDYDLDGKSFELNVRLENSTNAQNSRDK